jgi:hypothetical protein
MRRMNKRIPVVFVLSTLFAACGGTQTPAADPNACGEDACGPALGMPNELCADGVTQSGPTGVCSRDDSGECRWEVRSCPEPVEQACGGMVAGNGCPEGQFCDFPLEAMCGAADGTGVCRARAEMCPANHDPVCGCDDQTYSNACAAAQAGVSVGRTGECPPTEAAAGEACGTRGALPCAAGLFCDFPATANCGQTDLPGVCTAVPAECNSRMRRVCGCDGTTYNNACAANLAGVSVASTGACRAPR